MITIIAIIIYFISSIFVYYRRRGSETVRKTMLENRITYNPMLLHCHAYLNHQLYIFLKIIIYKHNIKYFFNFLDLILFPKFFKNTLICCHIFINSFII